MQRSRQTWFQLRDEKKDIVKQCPQSGNIEAQIGNLEMNKTTSLMTKMEFHRLSIKSFVRDLNRAN